MISNEKLKKIVKISYNTYVKKPKYNISNLKHKRIKDKHGFLADIYFDICKNTIYVSFQGITQNTLKSGHFKHNMRTGGAYEYSHNFPKLKFWINSFCSYFSESINSIKVVVIGHSMGGALAQMLISDILYKNIFKFPIKTSNISLITFNGLGGTIGNYFLNTTLTKNSRRNKKLQPVVKRLWRQVETYHFVHRDDIVAKILEHDNKHRIFIIDLDNKKTLNSFHGNENAHDIDVFYNMIRKKDFKPVHCLHNHFEHFNLNDFLNGWIPSVSLFYLLMFKTGEENFMSWLNPGTYYNKFKQIHEIKSEVLSKFHKIKKNTRVQYLSSVI
jgi:hypothetical protein